MSIEPRVTYRLQLRPDFGFAEAAAIAPYLAELGISHLYSSPYLQAAPGSTHGYDVVNYHRVNQDLGGRTGHAHLCQALGRHNLGQILDIVPNHMAITGPENPWWWDVLENGPASRYATYFDVEWDAPEAGPGNEILLPVLGDHYGRILEAGELTLHYEADHFTIRYYEQRFPVAPRSLADLLNDAAGRCGSDELAFIADAFSRLPSAAVSDRVRSQRRHRNKEVLGRQLARLVTEQAPIKAAIEAVVAETNDDPDALDRLLRRQNYRLAFWRIARQDLGYRRFFNINTLAGLRTEDDEVFYDVHRRVLGWLDEGVLDGLRIDHIDGLRDPEAYLRRLRRVRPEAWLVVEKILEPAEALRPTWPVAGTTGYDFLNRANNLFVDSTAETRLTQFYRDFTGEPTDFAALVYEKKKLVMRQVLGSDLNRLTDLFLAICERHRRHRDYTRAELDQALNEVAACFPVYRTYVWDGADQVSDDDRRFVNEAIEAAKENRPHLDNSLFDFLGDLLLLRIRGALEDELAMRFQQFTGPVMAKGVEDTTFYCYNRFVSLNEVGDHPDRFGLSVTAFHQACAETQANWPQTMLATSTHDTKRSEDVRARLNLLSEIPEQWTTAVQRWAELNARHRLGEWPDRNTEYLLYQTVVGAWPISVERLQAYMEKAVREAKVHTSWTDQNQEYETALSNFIDDVLADGQFVRDLERFVDPLITLGRVNSLAQVLLKLTAPGVPDLYQGTELWDLSLVDPDNRRPVDFDWRRRLLAELNEATPEAVWAGLDEGLPKLWVVKQALALRRRRPNLFGPAGDYLPLTAHGKRADHVVAFGRGDGAVTLVPRLVYRLADDWADTRLELPAGRWRNLLTAEQVAGGAVRVADLLARFPVCLLERAQEVT